jgi:carbonic anhydrase
MAIIGTQQSPIKIITGEAIFAPVDPGFLRFHYTRPLPGKVDGHNFVFDPPADEQNAADWSISVDGVKWLIRQIHVHAPAEHLIDCHCAKDCAKPFEAHLVHSSPGDVQAKGTKVVVGVFIEPGTETREKRSLDKFAALMAKRAGDGGGKKPKEIAPQDFLPDSGLDQFFRYQGSLTGEPYSEDVSWMVMKDIGIVEQAKFDALVQWAKHKARIIQPLNRRFVLKSFR